MTPRFMTLGERLSCGAPRGVGLQNALRNLVSGRYPPAQ